MHFLESYAPHLLALDSRRGLPILINMIIGQLGWKTNGSYTYFHIFSSLGRDQEAKRVGVGKDGKNKVIYKNISPTNLT